MYHMKKKFTKKVQRSTGIVNKKKNNKKLVTKKVKLSKKNLNKKNKRRPRIVKKGGSNLPSQNSLEGGNSHNKKQIRGRNEDTMGGSSCGTHDNGKMGGEGPNIEEDEGQVGGNNCGTYVQQMGGEQPLVEEEPVGVGGSSCDSRSKGGAHDSTPHTVGGLYKAQKGGNSCGCGV